jgi:hypothetical protein
MFFKALWEIRGLTAQPIMPGDVVDLDIELGQSVRALKPVDSEDPAPTTDGTEAHVLAPFPVQPSLIEGKGRGGKRR